MKINYLPYILKLSKYTYFYSIILIGIIVYSPTFFNGFVWDDIPFILNNQDLHTFNSSIFTNDLYTNNSIYRPILAIYFSFLYTIFGENPFPYHIIQLSMHIGIVSLLFIFLKKSFSEKVSFFLSLLFLIHPINSEAVYWISSIQSQLVHLTGISALLLSRQKELSLIRLLIVTSLLGICIFTNETGFLYLFLVLLYRYLFIQKASRKIIITSSGLLFFYIWARFLTNNFSYKYADLILGQLTITERLMHIPTIAVYYLKTFLFPYQILIDQYWTIKNFSLMNFWLPLLFIIIFIVLYGLFFHFLLKINKVNIKMLIKNMPSKASKYNELYLFLFFSTWWILSFCTFLQILPLNITIAERWFYIPFAGLLGVLAIIATHLPKKILQYQKHLFIGFIILLVLFSLRTYVRGFDWKDNYTLFTHEKEIQPDNYFAVTELSNIYTASGDFEIAIDNLKIRNEIVPHNPTTLNELGNAYYALKDYTMAEKYFIESIHVIENKYSSSGHPAPYINLAKCYLITNKPQKVISLLTDKILEKYNVGDLYIQRISAYVQLNDYTNAYKDAEYFYLNFDDPKAFYIYSKIKSEKEKIDAAEIQ